MSPGLFMNTGYMSILAAVVYFTLISYLLACSQTDNQFDPNIPDGQMQNYTDFYKNPDLKVADCFLNILNSSSNYQIFHDFIDNSIRNYLFSNTSQNTPQQSDNLPCVKSDSWVTACGISFTILNELLILNKTFGTDGVKICPTSIQLSYPGFGSLSLSFLANQDCPTSYTTIINDSVETRQVVPEDMLIKMIKNIISLIKISKTVKADSCCKCHSTENMMLDISSGIIYSKDSFSIISNPVIVINEKKVWNLILDANCTYKISRSFVENYSFLCSFLQHQGATLYFEKLPDISADNKATTSKVRNYFFIKRKCTGKLGFFSSLPVLKNGLSSTVSFERPVSELKNLLFYPTKYSICASLKSKPSTKVNIATPRTKPYRIMLSLLHRIIVTNKIN